MPRLGNENQIYCSFFICKLFVIKPMSEYDKFCSYCLSLSVLVKYDITILTAFLTQRLRKLGIILFKLLLLYYEKRFLILLPHWMRVAPGTLICTIFIHYTLGLVKVLITFFLILFIGTFLSCSLTLLHILNGSCYLLDHKSDTNSSIIHIPLEK